jgi:hypothetical protein
MSYFAFWISCLIVTKFGMKVMVSLATTPNHVQFNLITLAITEGIISTCKVRTTLAPLAQGSQTVCGDWAKNMCIILLRIFSSCRMWNGPSLWSSDQCSWLQIRRSGFDSLHYQIFWEVVSLERAPLSLAYTTEELLGRNSSGSGLENREYGRGNPLR